MGIIGAKGNNGIGVAGINWDVSMMLLKIGAQGTGRFALRGDGSACRSGSARTWSALCPLNPVLVLSCHCRQCSPSPRSEDMHCSSISIVACFLASPAPS
jgi:hypothetical protein